MIKWKKKRISFQRKRFLLYRGQSENGIYKGYEFFVKSRSDGLKFEKIFTSDDKEWLVLLHGLGGESRLFYKQIDALSAYYNLFLVNLPGHGGSEGLTSKYYTAKEVADEIEVLLVQEQIPKAHFITFSLGTIVGNELLHAKEHLLKTMVLIGPVLKFKLWSKFLIEFAWLFRNCAPYMLFYKMFAYIIMPKKSHKKSRFYFIREAAKLGKDEFVKWVYLLKNSHLPYSKAKNCFSEIHKLYLIGKEDHLFLKEAVHASTRDTSSDLVVLDGCGHVCIIEKPLECNRAILHFLHEQKNSSIN